MNFFMPINPPTTTAQERKIRIVNGKPVIYKPAELVKAEQILLNALTPFKPKKPLEGALRLHVVWNFESGSRHKDGEYRSTRPDTDNLEKLLKDCMTKKGYWKDDSQVAYEIIEKRWAKIPGISVIIKNLGEADNGCIIRGKTNCNGSAKSI